MLKHIVMWKFQEEALGHTRMENARIMKERLESLIGIIPEIRSLEVGINENSKECDFDAILTMEVEDQQALTAYLEHPFHREVSKFCKAVRVSRAAIDYTV